MQFTINREQLIKPLQQIAGVVEKRQTMPILSNVLIKAENNQLQLTATDMELQLKVSAENVNITQPGQVTAPARKLLDICKALPEDSQLDFTLNDNQLSVKSGRSRFALATLPASDFPFLEQTQSQQRFTIHTQNLLSLISTTAFSMAQNDVRYFLNGLLIELESDVLRTVSTDGHRLSLSEHSMSFTISEKMQVIVPRKGIQEVQRLFSDSDEEITVELSNHHIIFNSSKVHFVSKLIDGRFPDYKRVIPAASQQIMTADKSLFKSALTRVSILSNEKFRGVRFELTNNKLVVHANNPEQEKAKEEISVEYQGNDIEIAFNVSYLLDVLNIVKDKEVRISMIDNNSSILIKNPDEQDNDNLFVVMPMRL